MVKPTAVQIRLDTNRLRWGGVTYRSLEEIRRGRCRHSEVKRPIIVGLQLHRQLQPFLVLCGSSVEQLAEIHQVHTSLPCDIKPQLRFGCRALHFGWGDGPVECAIIASAKLSNCSAPKLDRRWAGSRTECRADRRRLCPRAHTHLDLLETSTRDAMRDSSASQTDRSAQQSRAALPTTPPRSAKDPAQEENLIGQSNKSVEEQWSQWTAGELWRVECETQSLRH